MCMQHAHHDLLISGCSVEMHDVRKGRPSKRKLEQVSRPQSPVLPTPSPPPQPPAVQCSHKRKQAEHERDVRVVRQFLERDYVPRPPTRHSFYGFNLTEYVLLLTQREPVDIFPAELAERYAAMDTSPAESNPVSEPRVGVDKTHLARRVASMIAYVSCAVNGYLHARAARCVRQLRPRRPRTPRLFDSIRSSKFAMPMKRVCNFLLRRGKI
jgi:hypothetical protein